MVIDLTKNNSISAINNFDPDICIKYYEKLKLELQKFTKTLN